MPSNVALGIMVVCVGEYLPNPVSGLGRHRHQTYLSKVPNSQYLLLVRFVANSPKLHGDGRDIVRGLVIEERFPV